MKWLAAYSLRPLQKGDFPATAIIAASRLYLSYCHEWNVDAARTNPINIPVLVWGFWMAKRGFGRAPRKERIKHTPSERTQRAAADWERSSGKEVEVFRPVPKHVLPPKATAKTLPDMDSNHNKGNQNPLCCHYTIGQIGLIFSRLSCIKSSL
jgi:hypothetical protein